MRRASRTRAVSAASTAALTLLPFGCAYEEPPISWEGEIIRFGADEPEAVCGDTLEWMDARALALAETFSAAGAEVYPRVDYYWLSESWSEQEVCSAETAAGCTVDDVIRSLWVPHQHELVHALRPRKLPLVFEEGLATLYGDLGYIADPAPRERLLEMLEASDPVDRPDYARASHFVGFLVERYGSEPLLAMGKITRGSMPTGRRPRRPSPRPTAFPCKMRWSNMKIIPIARRWRGRTSTLPAPGSRCWWICRMMAAG